MFYILLSIIIWNDLNEEPDEKLLIEVATIIRGNLGKMDGIKCVISKSCKVEKLVQYNLFG